MQTRPELWQRPVRRIAAAGGTSFRLAPSVRSGLGNVELIERPLRDADGNVPADVAAADILISGSTTIDASVASQLRDVRFVVRPYVGYDDIDVDALSEQGILFANVPDAFIEEVANHTLALILAGNRKLFPTDAFVKRGEWSSGEGNRTDSRPIRRPSVLTLGLVGFGNIGRLVAVRARPFGFRLIATDPYVDDAVFAEYGVEQVGLDELMQRSDIVSLHVLLNTSTRHLIDASKLALMKPDAYLVNTSRGPIVDEPALVDALAAGRIAGAGLDVFEVEPIPADSPLLGMPNVIATAHIASYSEEGDVAHEARTLEIIQRAVGGNLPERKVVVNKDVYDVVAAALRITEESRAADQVPAQR